MTVQEIKMQKIPVVILKQLPMASLLNILCTGDASKQNKENIESIISKRFRTMEKKCQ